MRELNERERQAVLDGDEEDIGKIVNIDKILKQVADKLEKQRTVTETASPLVITTKSAKSKFEGLSSVERTDEDTIERDVDEMSEVDSETKSRQEKDEK